jgi:hypothetical protein
LHELVATRTSFADLQENCASPLLLCANRCTLFDMDASAERSSPQALVDAL